MEQEQSVQVDLSALHAMPSANTRDNSNLTGNRSGYIHTYHLRHKGGNAFSVARFFMEKSGLQSLDKGLKLFDPQNGVVVVAVTSAEKATTLKGSKVKEGGDKTAAFTSDRLTDALTEVGLLDADKDGKTELNLNFYQSVNGVDYYIVAENDPEAVKKEVLDYRASGGESSDASTATEEASTEAAPDVEEEEETEEVKSQTPTDPVAAAIGGGEQEEDDDDNFEEEL